MLASHASEALPPWPHDEGHFDAMNVKLHIPAAAAEEHESPIAALMALTAPLYPFGHSAPAPVGGAESYPTPAPSPLPSAEIAMLPPSVYWKVANLRDCTR